jgi:hypothetical protein
MITIFGTTYYTWLAPYPLLFIIAFLIFLVLVFMLDHWIKTRRIKIPKGLAIWIIVLFVLEVILFWDVAWVAHEAKRLCKEEGGLHVYKSTYSDGFVGTTDINYWSNYGFKYVEDELSGRKFRFYLKNGKREKERISKFKSIYKISNRDERLNRYIKKTNYRVKNLITDQISGELVNFIIYPGKVDSFLLGKTGLTFVPWICGNKQYDQAKNKYVEITVTDLIKSTLTPTLEIDEGY